MKLSHNVRSFTKNQTIPDILKIIELVYHLLISFGAVVVFLTLIKPLQIKTHFHSQQQPSGK